MATRMTEDDLIAAARARVADRATRTEVGAEFRSELPPPARDHEHDAFESTVGFALLPLHRRMLTEIANGGFGPACGLFGLPDGNRERAGPTVLELRAGLGDGEGGSALPAPALPIAEWGCGIWLCLDEEADRVLTASEAGLLDIGASLHALMERWVHGESTAGLMFERTNATMINPFTRGELRYERIAQMLGTPYVPRRRGH